METMLVPDHEFYQAFGRLEGKIDLILSRSDDVERRLRTLEGWRWKSIGMASTISIIFSAATAFITVVVRYSGK